MHDLDLALTPVTCHGMCVTRIIHEQLHIEANVILVRLDVESSDHSRYRRLKENVGVGKENLGLLYFFEVYRLRPTVFCGLLSFFEVEHLRLLQSFFEVDRLRHLYTVLCGFFL